MNNKIAIFPKVTASCFFLCVLICTNVSEAVNIVRSIMLKNVDPGMYIFMWMALPQRSQLLLCKWLALLLSQLQDLIHESILDLIKCGLSLPKTSHYLSLQRSICNNSQYYTYLPNAHRNVGLHELQKESHLIWQDNITVHLPLVLQGSAKETEKICKNYII